MRLANLVRISAFRLTVLYTGLFSVSVTLLLSFIYYSTVAVIERQTTETIEAEVRGLVEQYRERGLNRLISAIHERTDADDESIYLLTDPLGRPIAGNLASWPETLDGSMWVNLVRERREGDHLVPYAVAARAFLLPSGHRLLVGRDTYEKSRFRDMLVRALAWSLVATIALGLLGGVVLSRRMLRRVQGVATTARRIAAGDLSQRLEKSGSGDEFDRLADSLNTMLARIERLMTGMRLASDSMAHDLRSPLTRLKSRVELALHGPPDPIKDREALAEILAQTDAALAVFDSLLNIALAEAGVEPADMETLALDALARDTADLYEPVAEDAGITLEVQTAAVCVRGQRQLLAQAVANLLDNAVKHTPAGGRVQVRVEEQGDAVALIVADSGPGIPEADCKRALERFVRLEPARSGPGAGLGLSLVAAVARLHDATIDLANNNPGLRFTLTFARC